MKKIIINNKQIPNQKNSLPLNNSELMVVNKSLSELTYKLSILLLSGEKIMDLLLTNINNDMKYSCKAMVNAYYNEIHEIIQKGDYD